MRWITPLLCLASLLAAASVAPAGQELTVRAHTIAVKVYPDRYTPTGEAGISLRGVRNGIFAGQVVVSSPTAIRGLKASATALTGAGTIPPSAVTIHWPMPDGSLSGRKGKPSFDSLEDDAPAEIPVTGERAIQPVWVRVAVAADARPGQYAGSLTISATGCPPVEVPVTLRVIDWTLPDPNDYSGHMDIVQSPESVALAYGVKMWSEGHLKLLDRTYRHLRLLADKTIYISAIRRTHFGNEQAIVRWVRDADGELQPDFTNAEKYLDLATKHLGKIPGVILLCWEPQSSMGHAGGAGSAGRTHDKPIQYTLYDPKTGRERKRTGPAWGTPEAKAFWKKFTDGIQPILATRGLEKSMMFGLIGDARPTKTAMDDITNAVPGAQWAIHSHHYCDKWQGYDIGMSVALWGIHLDIRDPAPKQVYGYGWSGKFWSMYYPREFAMNSPLPEHRYKLEMWMGAFSLHESKYKGTTRTARGLGRIGGDFWKVIKDDRGRIRSTLAGRYPESYWGQLNLNYCIPHILGKGKNGAVPTVRSEAFREGLQETEARVYVEKAFVMEDRRAKVGEDFAKRARTALDDRIRLVNRSGGTRKDAGGKNSVAASVQSGWGESGQMLYNLAAEAAKKLKD